MAPEIDPYVNWPSIPCSNFPSSHTNNAPRSCRRRFHSQYPKERRKKWRKKCRHSSINIPPAGYLEITTTTRLIIIIIIRVLLLKINLRKLYFSVTEMNPQLSDILLSKQNRNKLREYGRKRFPLGSSPRQFLDLKKTLLSLQCRCYSQRKLEEI